MPHTRNYDGTYEASPADTARAGEGATRIREGRTDLRQRLELDHYMNSSLDTTNPIADGYHKQITMKGGGSPAAMAEAGRLYTRTLGGFTELYYKDAAGNEIQLTRQGYVSQNAIKASDIITEKLADSAVTTNKIADGAITLAKLAVESYNLGHDVLGGTWRLASFSEAQNPWWPFKNAITLPADCSGSYILFYTYTFSDPETGNPGTRSGVLLNSRTIGDWSGTASGYIFYKKV